MRLDLLFALRTLGRTPVFTAAAILSLALGIGANTAIFSLLHQVLLRSLPVPDPERMVTFHFAGDRNGSSNSDNDASVFSYPFYRDFRDHVPLFTGIIARAGSSANVLFNNQAELTGADVVSGNFFDVLGVKPILGRLFTAADDLTPGGHPVAILTHAYWTRRFGASPAILNQTIRVNGLPMTVIGITPRNFLGVVGGQSPDLYVPLAMRGLMNNGIVDLEQRDAYWLNIFARLRPGVTIAQAQASLAPVFRAAKDQDLAAMRNPPPRYQVRFLASRLELHPAAQGVNQLRRQWQRPLMVVMVMVGLVLLIACFNVANLLISRAAARSREIFIRLALGASGWQLLRQFFTESLLLALAGGLTGLLFTNWITRGLIALVSRNEIGGWLTPAIDIRLLAFTIAASLLTGLLFGLAPAISATRTTAPRSHLRFRRLLISTQVALSLVLLIACGLFARSFLNLLHHDLGFRAERLLVFSINPALSGYKGPAMLAFCERLRDRLGALPGVSSVAVSQMTPLSNTDYVTNMTVEGYRAAENQDANANVNAVSAGYFRTLGIPLVAGREFSAADHASAPKTAIINEAFAGHFFQGRDPIGRHITPGAGTVKPDIEIVGVVHNFNNSSLREKRSVPFYFLPYLQRPNLRRVTFSLRANAASDTLPNLARAIVHETDANVPVIDLQWMKTQIGQRIYLDRLLAWLATAFGVLAMLLAALGLYGVIAYLAARRTVEIGIRVALGATRGGILWLVLREVAFLVAAGLAIGIPTALLCGSYVQTQLFGIRAHDPVVLIAAAAILTITALLAGYLPARRAASIDPLGALRHE